jgi:hypothetical protein
VISFAGDADAQLLVANGSGVADTFHIRPDQDTADVLTPIVVNGLAPVVAPGDVLNLDASGLGVPTLLLGPGANNGQYLFGGAAASVTYSSIESIAGVTAVNLVLDMKLAGFETGGGDADEIFLRLDPTGTNVLVDVDGVPIFSGTAATIQSLTVIGSADDDRLRIDETAGGLPKFAGQTPAIDNIALGGGAANASHLNASADLVLETLFGGLGPWDASDATIHFDGRGGADAIDLNFTTLHDTVYTSDALDTANSGNLTAAGATPDFVMSFAGLAPLNLSGVGGTLLVDATSTPATGTLTLADDAVAADGWSQVAGDGGL